MVRASLSLMTLLLLPLGYVCADTPPDLGANAALKYWQAFATLPRFSDAEAEKLKAEYLTMPLDAHAREILSRAQYALLMMHHGAAVPRCAWGVGYEEGIHVELPHGPAARVLATLACLRARFRFESNQPAEALNDIMDVMTLGRHVSLSGTNIMALVGIAVEYVATETLARYLPKLDPAAIKEVKTRLGALPAGMSLSGSLQTEEKFFLDWFIRTVKESKDNESVARNLTALGQIVGPEGNPGDVAERNRKAVEEARALVTECGGIPGMLKFAEETRLSYVSLGKKLDLPPDQFEKEFETEKTRQAGNPVFKMFFPAMDRVRVRYAQLDVRRALLAAAIAVQIDGRDGLKNLTDPVAGGMFEYAPFQGGFELRSNWKPDGKPVELIVGQRGN
jgi:hypothetical protein